MLKDVEGKLLMLTDVDGCERSGALRHLVCVSVVLKWLGGWEPRRGGTRHGPCHLNWLVKYEKKKNWWPLFSLSQQSSYMH